MADAQRSERNVLVVTGVAHAATHYAELIYPTLAVVLVSETGLPYEQVIGYSFVGYLLFGLGALPAGMLADRVGARRVLLGSLAGMAVGLLAAGLAAPGVGLTLALAVLGLGASAYHPAGMGLISRAVSARGRGLAINGICGNLGIALTPLVTAAVGEAYGWRAPLVASGVLLLALTALCASMPIDEPPVQHAHQGDHESSPSARRLAFGVLCIAAVLGGISYRGNTLAQPALFDERVSLMGFGAATSLVYLVGVVGQYVGGAVADRYPLRWGYLAFHAASLPALILIAALTEVPLLVAAGTFVFFSLGMQPIENSLYAQLTPDRWRSTAYGLKFILTFGVGSVAVWIVRVVEAERGLVAVFPVLGGVVALLVATIAVLAAVLGRSAGPRPVAA